MANLADIVRRGGRILAYAVGITLALVIVAVFIALVYVNTPQGEQQVRKYALAQVHESIPGLSVEQIGGFIPFSFELREVSLHNLRGELVGGARRVEVDLKLLPLLDRTVAVDELVFIEPYLLLEPTAQGPLNITQVIEEKPPDEEKAKPWDMRLRNVRIRGGLVRIIRAGEAENVVLGDIQLTGSARKSGRDFGGTLEELRLDFAGFRGGGRLVASGQVATRGGLQTLEGRLRAEVTGLIDQDPLNINIEVAGVDEHELQGELRLSMGSRGRARIQALVDTQSSAYDATAQLSRLDLRALLSSLPQGELSAALWASGHGVPLSAGSDASVRVAGGEISVSDSAVETLQLVAHADGVNWELERLALDVSGVSLGAEGRGTIEQAELRIWARAPEKTELSFGEQSFAVQGDAKADVAWSAESGITLDANAELPLLATSGMRAESLTGSLQADAIVAQRRASARLRLETFALNRVQFQRLGITAEVQPEQNVFFATARSVLGDVPRGLESPLVVRARLPLVANSWEIDRKERLEVLASWQHLDFASALALLGLDAPSRGDVGLDARVEGTLAALRLELDVRLRDGGIRGLEGLNADIAARGGSDGIVATLDARVHAEPALAAEARLDAPLENALASWTGSPLQASVHVPRANLQWLSLALPGVEGAEGRAEAHVRMSGTAAHPSLNASARLADVRWDGREVGSLRLSLHGAAPREETSFEASLSVEEVPAVQLEATLAATPLQLVDSRARGRVPVELFVHLGPADLSELNGVARRDFELGGVFAASAEIEGALDDLSGSFHLYGDALVFDGEPLGSLSGHLDVGKQMSTAVLRLEQQSGSGMLSATLEEGGTIQVIGDLERLDLGPIRERWLSDILASDFLSGDLQASVDVALDNTEIWFPDSLRPLVAARQARVNAELSNLGVDLFFRKPERAEPEKPAEEFEPQELDEMMRERFPFLIERLAIRNADIQLVDATVSGNPALGLRDSELTLENVGTRRELMGEVPAVLGFRTLIEGSGETTAFVTFDPLAEQPAAAGQAAIVDLSLSRLHEFLQPVLGIEIPRGVFNCYVTFVVRDGELTGGVKPVLEHLEIDPADGNPLRQAGVELADVVSDILSDEIPRRDALATVLPIKGELDQPQMQWVPAVLGVVRNAFVAGLASGFVYLPPETAEERETWLEQARQALTRRGEPLEAQPTAGGEREDD